MADLSARTVQALRRSVSGRGRRLLLVSTLLLGVLVAVLVAVATPVPSVAVLAMPVQLLMSVLVPLAGVLLARDLVQDPVPRIPPVLLAAAIYAAAVALVGFAVCLLVAALTPSAVVGPPGPALSAALGGVGLQVTAQLVGTGLGLLIRSALVAFLGTIALPLGLWLLLGVADSSAPLRQWLTPFGATPPLLTGAPSTLDLLAWGVVLVLWGGGLNLAGASRLRRMREALRP